MSVFTKACKGCEIPVNPVLGGGDGAGMGGREERKCVCVCVYVCTHVYVHTHPYLVRTDVTRDVTFPCTMYLE